VLNQHLPYKLVGRFRVIVHPEVIGDNEAFALARDIAKKIEEELIYPGQIKVTVVRETRVAEYAK